MERGTTGRYEGAFVGGDRVEAFIPEPLPPVPPISLDGELARSLEAANNSLGRLDGISEYLPDRDLLVYFYIRKEAVMSSQIEGTQSSLSDILRHELEEAPGAPIDDVIEVSNYVRAFHYGLQRMQELPLCSRLVREIHRVLLASGRGSDKQPGSFRCGQVWIGSGRVANAVHVPPPHIYVEECMADLENFMNTTDDDLPILIKAGIAHVQFETIHPFLDGNGRVGRLLITLILISYGLMRHPVLYLSLYLKAHRLRYFDLLSHIRRTGDWEAWIAFFLDAVKATADSAVESAQRTLRLFEADRIKIEQQGRAAGSMLRVHQVLKETAIVSSLRCSSLTGLSRSAVGTALNALVEIGIVREITGGQRNRLFAYQEHLSILSEGAELD